jgi:hypothetical protein
MAIRKLSLETESILISGRVQNVEDSIGMSNRVEWWVLGIKVNEAVQCKSCLSYHYKRQNI